MEKEMLFAILLTELENLLEMKIQIASLLGVMLSLLGTDLNWKERLFCTISYIPKATVQAAMGAVPLSLGVESGDIILAISVLFILITAALGAIGINYSAEKLL